MKLIIIFAFIASVTAQSSRIGTIVQIADPHPHPKYTPGAGNDCAIITPIKIGGCRPDCIPTNKSKPAGFWGDYKCDPPPWFIIRFLQFMSIPNPDLVMYSGDTIHHDDFHQSPEIDYHLVDEMTNYLKQYFPKSKIAITLGNHEWHFVDQFNSKFEKYQKMLNGYAFLFRSFINDTNFGKYGFYATYFDNIRILNLNTVVWQVDNLERLFSDDAVVHWHWLETQLQDAKTKNQTVYVHAHICPGSSAFSDEFNNRFELLLAQYKNIKFIACGHVHTDEYTLIRDINKRVVNVAFLAPSMMPSGHNPGARVYYYNKDTGEILDYVQYYIDLDKLNADDQFIPRVLYHAKTGYGITDFSPKSWGGLAMDICHKRGIFELYNRRRFLGYDPGACDEKCWRDVCCDVLYVNTHDKMICQNAHK